MFTHNELVLASVPEGCDLQPIGEVWDSHIYDKLLPIREGMTVVDVGASIGFFSLYASQKVGSSGKVIAFEPEPRTYQVLAENINRSTNIHPVNLGLWNRNDILPLHVAHNLTGSSIFENVGATIPVQVERLDEVLPKLNVYHVDFMKIDAEGAAMQILEGAEGMLPYIDNFAIAAYHSTENVGQIQKFLEAHGYRTKILTRYGLYPFVYATRDKNISLEYFEAWKILVPTATLVVAFAVYWKFRKK